MEHTENNLRIVMCSVDVDRNDFINFFNGKTFADDEELYKSIGTFVAMYNKSAEYPIQKDDLVVLSLVNFIDDLNDDYADINNRWAVRCFVANAETPKSNNEVLMFGKDVAECLTGKEKYVPVCMEDNILYFLQVDDMQKPHCRLLGIRPITEKELAEKRSVEYLKKELKSSWINDVADYGYEGSFYDYVTETMDSWCFDDDPLVFVGKDDRHNAVLDEFPEVKDAVCDILKQNNITAVTWDFDSCVWLNKEYAPQIIFSKSLYDNCVR